MKRKIVWLVVSGLMVLSLLAASCAPAVEEAAPTTPTAPTAPTTPTTPTAPTAPTGPEMVKVSLKKMDGTVVEKLVEKPRYGGEVIIARKVSIAQWDEGYAFVGGTIGGNFPTYEKLTQGNWAMGPAGTGEASWTLGGWNALAYQVPALAESWELVQPDTMIFHLRKGVRFGLNPAIEESRLVGGREMTADDWVANLQRKYRDVLTSGNYRSAGASSPKEFSATDKYTLVVKAPEGQFWQTLEFVAVHGVHLYAPEIGKKYGDYNLWTRNVGTGPFVIKDYLAMSQITWMRNPNYWMKDPFFPENQLPYLDSIKMLIIPDDSTRMSGLRTGKIDIDYTQIEWENAAALKKTNPELKYGKGIPSGAFFGGRVDKPELPFKDIRVRRALMMAINYPEWIATYYGGNADVLWFPTPPVPEFAPVYTPLDELGLAADGFDSKKLYTYHPEEAKKLLTEAGYPNGFKTEVVFPEKDKDMHEIIANYWKKNLNVDLKLDVRENAVVESIKWNRGYKEMVTMSGYALATAYKYYEFRKGASVNYAMVDDPVMDERYARMAALELWTPEWVKVVKDNALYALHQAYYVPRPLPHVTTFWQPWVMGYHGETAVGGYDVGFVKYVWIDQELKKAKGH